MSGRKLLDPTTYNILRIRKINFLNINHLNLLPSSKTISSSSAFKNWRLESCHYSFETLFLTLRAVHNGFLTTIGPKHGRRVISYVFFFVEDLCCNIDGSTSTNYYLLLLPPPSPYQFEHKQIYAQPVGKIILLRILQNILIFAT